MNKTSTFIILNLWWLIPVGIVLMFWQHTAPILFMLVFAYLGHVVLNPIINILGEWIGSRKWAVIIIVALFIIIISVLSSSLFPLIGRQITAFKITITMETFPKFLLRVTTILENILPAVIVNFINDFFSQYDSEFIEIWASGLSHIKSFIGRAGTVAFALGSAFLSFLIIVVFMIIFLLEGKKFSYSFLQAVPGKHYGTVKRMLEKTSNQIHSYIRGQLIAACSVAFTSIMGLYILQWITDISIPYTYLIGITAGLFNLIPFVGPIMGMIPAIIIYLVTDQVVPIHFIYVILILIIFAIVQLIDNLVISPYIMGSSVGLHPILVIILVLLGASAGGILGMFFAVPIAAIVKVVVVELVTSLKK